MSAPKTRTRSKRKSAEETMHETLARIMRGEVPQPIAAAFLSIVGRSALAAIAQSKAGAARVRAGKDTSVDNDVYNVKLRAEAETERETCAAGAALAKALRYVKVPS